MASQQKLRTKHDFFGFMGSVKDAIAKEYAQIQRRVSEDPGTAGDQVEESWAQFFRNWLPATYHVVTKGRILFADKSASNQVDILVLHPTYPIELRNKKLFFAGGVIAAFECKLTLKKQHLVDAFKRFADIKRRMPPRAGSPYEELWQLPYCGLIAHSHSWKGKRGSWAVHDQLEKYQHTFAEHPRELLDIICVADAGVFPLSKVIVTRRSAASDELKELRRMGLREAVSTMYTIHDEDPTDGAVVDQTGSILGGLIQEITSHMAFEDETIKPWARHLVSLDFYLGIGRPTYWSMDVLSDSLRKEIATKSPVNEVLNKWSWHT